MDSGTEFYLRLLQQRDPAVLAEAELGDDLHSAEITPRTLFRHHDTHPIVLELALLRLFGHQWLEWEAETIWREVKETLSSDVSFLNKSQVQAMRSLHLSDRAWHEWEVFAPICQALNNNVPSFDRLVPPTIAQSMNAVDIFARVKVLEFAAEPRRLIAGSFLYEDVCYCPPPVEFAQEIVSAPYHTCPDCGSTRPDLPLDGRCDVCSGRYSQEHPLSLRQDPDVKTKEGGRIETFLRRPFALVKARFEEASRNPAETELGENAVDIQVAKLLVGWLYLAYRNSQLQRQLAALADWLKEEGDAQNSNTRTA